MKKTLFTMAVLCAITASARVYNDEYAQVLRYQFENRSAASVKGDNDVFAPDNDAKWRDGNIEVEKVSFVSETDETTHIGFLLDNTDYNDSQHFYAVKMFNGKPRVMNRKGVTVKHETVGPWDLLVFRNSAGAVIDMAIATSDKEREMNEMIDMNALFDGIYVSAKGDTAVFGAELNDKRDHFTVCPGVYQVMTYTDGLPECKPDENYIAFAENRMKVVEMPSISKKYDEQAQCIRYYADGKEISKKEYEFIESRPCGYGGHGSLMGPIVWKVKRTATGLHVELTQPYDANQDWRYSPFSDEKFDLTWVRSVYPGYKGRWAVASVRPLTRNMLRQFDKATLRAMVKGINARHTRDKKFSAIEKLNKSLINTMIAEK